MKRTVKHRAVTCLLLLLILPVSCSQGKKMEKEPATGTPALSSPDEAGKAAPTDALENSDTSPLPESTLAPTSTLPPAPVTDGDNIACLVNREFALSEDFVPKDLTVPDIVFSFSDISVDKAKMTKEAAEALTEMFDAAYEEEKLVLYGVSAYRSYQRQYTIYAINLAQLGTAQANRVSAAPGRSEHQTGLSIDISCRSEGYSLEESFATTAEAQWAAQNAHRFGFILRYPKGKEEITGYSYEPWHLRYVGCALAKELYERNLTLEEYYGVPSSLSQEYLETNPLIDTTTGSYQSIYQQYH